MSHRGGGRGWRGRESRGKGKRKFAARGSWRSGGPGEAGGEPLVLLQRPAGAPIPAPESKQQPAAEQGRPWRRRDEYKIAELARKFWGAESAAGSEFSEQLVEGIYQTLQKAKFSSRVVMALEYSQYLENYLWPHFTAKRATPGYLVSMVLMVSEKRKERVPAWEAFENAPGNFRTFFHRVLEACTTDWERYSIAEHAMLLLFLVHAFNSLEVDLVREQLQRLVSLPIWINLTEGQLEQELKAEPKLRKYWNAIQKRDRQADEETRARALNERRFLFLLMQRFLEVLSSVPAEGALSEDSVSYCERFLELMTDLQAQLPTRRFFNTLLGSVHLVVQCNLSALAARRPEGHLFNQLLERLKFYCGFEINDQTGSSLTDHEMTDIHYNRITSLQRAAFKLFPDLRPFALSNVASVDTRKALIKHFSPLSQSTLHEIAANLNLVAAQSSSTELVDRKVLQELLVAYHERRRSQLQELNDLPLYPTEEILWDENVVPSEYYNGETCLALPKLNLQFLTLHDYLLRNYTLFRLESTYEIREDVEDVVSRLKPWETSEGGTQFSGWARMALPIASFSVVEVGRPNVGENRPSRVKADVSVELNVTDLVKREWEGLRKHDVCFLVTVKAKMAPHQTFDWSQPFVSQVGLESVRGCEVEGLLDEEGRVIEEGPEPRPVLTGTGRTFRVWLDTNQYQRDMARVVRGEEDVYEAFNIFVRRKPKENNFKAVLETIRDLMNTECVVPEWLHDVFLGYGDPAAAHYASLEPLVSLDFNDTFLSLQHVTDSFPQYNVQCTTEGSKECVPPFKLVFSERRAGQKRRRASDEDGGDGKTLLVEPYTTPNRGPYPYNQPKKNAIPFTPTQVEAIRSGMQPGLTLVVGPPGTGKTDVAVQIISNLYHNFPEQRTLLVTHSNQALNQLFEKIMALDIDERHLLRLGHGEEELATEKDFSRFGRVNFILALRMELLGEVKRLQESLGVLGDVSYSCETAGHFFLYQLVSRWEQFTSKVSPLAAQPEGLDAIVQEFPFTKYFSNAPQPIFKGESFQQDWEIAEGCFSYIKKIFKQLEEFRAFELLRNGRDRVNYLLVKEAKIIAMTCTHAALKRRDLVELAFKYDNVLMEEAAQILEVETFIPLMLQNPQDGFSRLKRVVMIGDHHQLPPVIKNMAFQKYSNLEQSLFTRFIRLGVPAVHLDAQGRARPSLCRLYNWRYKTLGDLPHVSHWPEYTVANPGFAFDYQLIDVGDFNGVGESEPTPYFYQNLGEAEFAVALFMFMRLQGFPPERIAILTTYNGQKHLIRDVLARRCAHNPVFGLPEKVTTVDRYQGQQNDYIILSLVRTKHVGHLRDVRRLVVAMSRARLGLYILARVPLFQSCTELQPAFSILMQRPLQLYLVPDEFYPSTRPIAVHPDPSRLFVVSGMPHLADYVHQDYNVRLGALREQQAAAAAAAKQQAEEEGDEVVLPPVELTTPTDEAEGSGVGEDTKDSVMDETTPTDETGDTPTAGDNVNRETTPTGCGPSSDAVEQQGTGVDEATPTGAAETTPITRGTVEGSVEQEATPTGEAETTPTTSGTIEASVEQEATPEAAMETAAMDTDVKATEDAATEESEVRVESAVTVEPEAMD